jgi:predicted DCC family thiol-disulfide oxidoreductase YuxK
MTVFAGLCNRLVQFTLRHDRNDEFRFESLQSPTAGRVLARHGAVAAELATFYIVTNLDQPGERLLGR